MSAVFNPYWIDCNSSEAIFVWPVLKRKLSHVCPPTKITKELPIFVGKRKGMGDSESKGKVFFTSWQWFFLSPGEGCKWRVCLLQSKQCRSISPMEARGLFLYLPQAKKKKNYISQGLLKQCKTPWNLIFNPVYPNYLSPLQKKFADLIVLWRPQSQLASSLILTEWREISVGTLSLP